MSTLDTAHWQTTVSLISETPNAALGTFEQPHVLEGLLSPADLTRERIMELARPPDGAALVYRFGSQPEVGGDLVVQSGVWKFAMLAE